LSKSWKSGAEAALRQHILRASFQTKVWHTSCLAKPPLPSPMEYGWRTVKDSLLPVYFEGSMMKQLVKKVYIIMLLAH
jgi:hypothetical protein